MPSLGNDLAAIRKKKGLSIEDMQQSTKISSHILRSIEDDSIFEQLEDNTTYTRSYVRSYARALGIEDAKIVPALNQLEAGTYEGGLLKQKNIPASPPPENRKKPDSEAKKKNHQSEKDLSKRNKTTSKVESNKTAPKVPEPPSQLPRKATPDDWDWVLVGKKTKRASSGTRGKQGLLIIILLVIIIAIGFLIYAYFYAESDTAGDTQPGINAIEQPKAPSDSLRQTLIREKKQPALASSISTEKGALPDTLTIGIYAASGKLNPVRVYTDILGKKTPYWVSRGDTIRLNFVNKVQVETVNQYDQLQLLVNGHIIPNFYRKYYNSKISAIELDRSMFRNNPKWRRVSQEGSS